MINSIIYALFFCVWFIIEELYCKRKGKTFSNEVTDETLLSIDQTTILKGVAILLVFLGHVGNKNYFAPFFPWGGVGVSVFLLCSGYGIEESVKKHDFSFLSFWKRRLMAVVLPYAITRIVYMAFFRSSLSFVDVVLDLFCLKPQYELGWYLPFLLFWYLIFSVSKVLGKKHQLFKRIEVPLFVLISVSIFLFSDSMTVAQQALSFPIGIMLSKLPTERKSVLKKNVWVFVAILFVLGLVSLAIKKVFVLDEMIALQKTLHLMNRLPWGIAVMLSIIAITKKMSLRMFSHLGVVSYEVYLVHGYLLEVMKETSKIWFVLIFTAAASIVLHLVSQIIRKICYRRKLHMVN